MKGLHARSTLFLGIPLCFPLIVMAANVTPEEIAKAKLDSEPKFSAMSTELVEIKYKIKNGQSFSMDMDMKATSETKYEGRKIIQNLGRFTSMAFRAVKTYPNGDADLILTIKRIKINKSMGNHSMSFDSSHSNSDGDLKSIKAIINVPITMTLSDRGRTKRGNFDPLYKAVAKVGKPAIVVQMRQSMQDIMKSALVVMPEGKIKVGSTYSAGIMKNSNKNSAFESQMNIYIAGISVDKKMAILRTIIKIKSVSLGKRIRLTHSDVKGWVKFDLEKGMFVESRMQIVMDMNYTQGKKSTTIKNTVKEHVVAR